MIAVLSDSHVPSRAGEIPSAFMEKVRDADTIVHCGDFETREVYGKLQGHGDLVAVKGNCDRFDLPASETFSRSGVEFGVYHGTGIHPRGDRDTLADTAENKLGVDVLLHGHTHRQEAVEHRGKLLMNPGSCTGAGGGSSSGGNPEMLTLEPGKPLEVRLLELENGSLKADKRSFEVTE